MPMEKALTLYELNSLVRETIEEELHQEYWVEAELSEVREVRGHCYMQLVQYDRSEEGGKRKRYENTPIAQASAKCWQSSWQLLRPYFEKETGQRLHAGMKVLLQVYANFHETYGFSWIVTDIDPTYTMGDMARKRQEIIRVLKDEGVFDLQKELPLPLFCQRIAVISSANAAGYGDFVNQLENNEYGFQFHTRLFPAVMQGEQVEKSIITALNRIYSVECRTENVEFATASESTAPESTAVANSTLYTLHSTLSTFDCVVIIRGGGSTSDLSGFDTLALAENVAQFPLPIITGIGHERDDTIIDMVSHTRVKTPTAAAEFLIHNQEKELDYVNNLADRITNNGLSKIANEKVRLQAITSKMPSLYKAYKAGEEARLDRKLAIIQNSILQNVQRKLNVTAMREQQLKLYATALLNKKQNRLDNLDSKAGLFLDELLCGVED
jgi:exodeoxyribonuclease VII large subunit